MKLAALSIVLVLTCTLIAFAENDPRKDARAGAKPARTAAGQAQTAQGEAKSTPARPETKADAKSEVKPRTTVQVDVIEVKAVAGVRETLAARALAARGADFDRIPVVLGLTGEALEAYKKKLAERNDGYEKWLKSARGQEYAAAQRATGANGRLRSTTARNTDAGKKYQELRLEQESVRRELRRQLNSMFDARQLRIWAGDMLYFEAAEKLGKLTDEQKQQAYVLCLTLAATQIGEGDAQRDPYLKPSDAALAQAQSLIRALVLGEEPAKK